MLQFDGEGFTVCNIKSVTVCIYVCIVNYCCLHARDCTKSHPAYDLVKQGDPLCDFTFSVLFFWIKVRYSSTQRSSHITLCLYEKWLTRRDVVIGTHELLMPIASQSGPSLFRFSVRSTN